MIDSVKAGQAVAAMTTTTGVGDWLGWIPDDIGKVGVLVGMVLSVVMIRQGIANRRKLLAEAERAELQVAEMKRAAEAAAG